jgi:hypothetical protein
MLSTKNLINTSLQVSRFSLLFGTALLLLFFLTDNNDVLVALVSVPLILVMGLYNLKLLGQLIWRGYQEQESRKALWRAGALMSLNIPAALLYAKLVLMLSNTLLVRLVNTTNQPLRHVVVVGCGEQRPLADLPPGQATILWLPISAACFERTVSVQYSTGSTTQQAIIDGYVVEGRRINVKLGSDQQATVTKR